MKIYLFANRNIKEVLRDPISLFFGIGFPIILLALLSVINAAIPAEANNPIFEINNLAPGLSMFGSVFMAMFTGMILSKDRTSSFLTRLLTSPMTVVDFLLGYTAPMIIITAVQSAITFFAANIFGLPFSIHIIPAIFTTSLTSLLFIGTRLLAGTLLNDKAVGGVCGALLTNIAGWLSGVFIPLELIGGVFKSIANALPFYHNVVAIQNVLNGNFNEAAPHLAVVLGYTVVIYILATIAFRHKMSSDKYN